jgi:serine/threonine protein kinase
MPTRISRYQIKQPLGQGVTGTVYLAEDPFNGREVALKVASPQVFCDPRHGVKYRKMFMNEAALAGRLHHPHIVRLHEAGAEGDVHYIVMEYVPGGTLERYCLPSGLLPYDKTAEIAFKCCRALEYAFRQGVIHRDIKPANILLAGGTDIKVSDFGAALWHSAEHTQLTGVVGSPLYMSPEQIRGEALTHQTDIYSLGVVLYQMLCGRPPYDAENEISLLSKILSEPPRPLARARTDLPPPLAAIVERAMSKELTRRYPSWNEFARDLAEFYARHAPPSEDIADSYKFNTLKTLHFFGDFADAELWEFVRLSEWRRFPTERVLLEENKAGSSFFLLAAGEARVTKNGKLLGVLAAGDSFGEMAYIYQERRARTASIIANTDVVLIKVRAETMVNASDNLQLHVTRMFLRTLANRLERTNAMLAAS